MSYIKHLQIKMEEKKLADLTIDVYINTLRILNKNKNYANLDFLNDTAVIAERLKVAKGKPVKDNTIKNRLTAILGIFKLENINNDIYKFYKNLHEEVDKPLKSRVGKTETEKENWVTIGEINKIKEELKATVIGVKRSTFDERQKYFLLSLYTDLTPRRNIDYIYMDIITGKYNESELGKGKNYLLMDKKKMIINQHKNTNTKGTEYMDFTDKPKFIEALNLYVDGFYGFDKSKGEYRATPLLQYRNGSSWENHSRIRDILISIFKKKVGSTMLRKIISTEMGIEEVETEAGTMTKKAVILDMLRQSKEMGHSINTHLKYYIKDVKDD